jgi:hypothetical protein
MQTVQSKTPLTRRRVVALRGLRLPRIALQQLAKCGIYCQPAVSIEYQQQADRYVILGRESGGAVTDIGAYCGFVSLSGQPPEWVSRVEPLAPNGVHSTVVSPSLIRIHVFRNQGSFDLLITRHELIAQPERQRPALHNRILFHGAGGTLPQLPGLPQQPRTPEVLPEFRSRSGDAMPVPAIYLEAVRAAIAGARCLGCLSPHLLAPPCQERCAIPGESHAG